MPLPAGRASGLGTFPAQAVQARPPRKATLAPLRLFPGVCLFFCSFFFTFSLGQTPGSFKTRTPSPPPPAGIQPATTFSPASGSQLGCARGMVRPAKLGCYIFCTILHPWDPIFQPVSCPPPPPGSLDEPPIINKTQMMHSANESPPPLGTTPLPRHTRSLLLRPHPRTPLGRSRPKTLASPSRNRARRLSCQGHINVPWTRTSVSKLGT